MTKFITAGDLKHAAVKIAVDATEVHVCCMYRIILILTPNSEDLKIRVALYVDGEKCGRIITGQQLPNNYWMLAL